MSYIASKLGVLQKRDLINHLVLHQYGSGTLGSAVLLPRRLGSHHREYSLDMGVCRNSDHSWVVRLFLPQSADTQRTDLYPVILVTL